ncbi:MAG: glycoside hydrolase family 3 C-terminal domain-containing protein [Thermoguttaceae bacterium]
MTEANDSPNVDWSFLDTSLPLGERVERLVAQMTVDEKTSQMVHSAPAIERLRVPAYNWWNECLHGVARAGKATVFPQAIGMAASFDAPLLEQVAAAISDEARAKHHQAIRQGNRRDYFGLTFWSPNINIFRDPRWGRGQETYGEDPHLTGRLGVAFVRGLQGDDPRHLKVVATPKHFAAHSGPERERHTFDAAVSPRDLAETYLPAFKACVREGKAASVMAAYNRLNGEACCASPTLLEDTLRREWGFEGYVVSDCGAIDDFHKHHKVAATAAEAAAMAVRNGCDLTCDLACPCSYGDLLLALRQGLVSEAEIDRSVRRLFAARFRLGMFDPESEVRYASIPPEVAHCQRHRELARQMARESIVLLKNDRGLLPLAKELRHVLVVGPNARNPDALLGNYCGIAPRMCTPWDGILDALSPGSAIDYLEGCDLASDKPVQEKELKWYLAKKDPELIVAVLGYTAALEGEEGDTAMAEGDRGRLALPGRQQQLLELLVASGKPVVLVVAGGSPIDLAWARDHVPAILLAWYPGEEGGAAIADVLFGDCNPAGRLPITLVRSLDDVPPMGDYAMRGRTYRFSNREPLYPFGHGLSYTRFAYGNLRLSRRAIAAGDQVEVRAEVRNAGDRAGDEVVQLYVSDLAASVPVPKLHLEGFRRVHLLPGQTVQVAFTLGPEQFAAYDDQGRPMVEPGEFLISVGGGQPGGPAGGAVQTKLTVT